MNYKIITTILRLLSSTRLQDQDAKLINQLNNLFNFDHNIFLVKTTADPNRYIPSPDGATEGDSNYTPRTVFILNDDSINNITGMGTPNGVKSKKLFLIVVVDDLIHGNLWQLFNHILKLRDLNIQVKIGLFFAENVESVGQIMKLFKWSWDNQISNIFCAFYSSAIKGTNSEPLLNVFKFNPFGTFDLINITGSESIEDYFPSKFTDLRKHPLRLVTFEAYQLTIFEANIWNTIKPLLNASLILYVRKVVANLSSQVLNPEEILSHEVIVREGSKDALYPHRSDPYVIVVPHATLYLDFMGYLKNETWGRLFAYTFIVIVLTTLMLIVTRYWTKRKILFFQSVADIFNLLMNDNGSVRYSQLHFAEICVVVPLTFAGLIVVNGIVSIFQSYLTLPIYESQINNIKDLFKSPVPIVADELDWVNLTVKAMENLSNHGGWMEKVHSVSHVQFDAHIMSFNRSVAFCILHTAAKEFLEAQERFNVKAYYVIPGVALEKFLVSFSINPFHVLIERINEIIHRMQSAGLIAKWQAQLAEAKIKFILERNVHRKFDVSANTDEISIPSLIWYGWLASGIVFIFEMIWNKVKPQQIIEIIAKVKLWKRT